MNCYALSQGFSSTIGINLANYLVYTDDSVSLHSYWRNKQINKMV